MDFINFAKIREDAIIPTRDNGNAGYDIYANFPQEYMLIKPFTTERIPTGIAIALPYDKYFQVEERGSTGIKGIKKSAGVIDPSFRGEVFIVITNSNDKPILITKSENTTDFDDEYVVYPYSKAIAQLVLHDIVDMPSEEITYEKLKEIPSVRGIGCLGSTGK